MFRKTLAAAFVSFALVGAASLMPSATWAVQGDPQISPINGGIFGDVIDDNHEPVINFTVTLLDSNLNVFSGPDPFPGTGKNSFILENLPEDVYTVIVEDMFGRTGSYEIFAPQGEMTYVRVIIQ